jgi:hypothetical protein
MSSKWTVASTTRSTLGRFQIVFGPPGGAQKDVTFFRDIPTVLETYSSADPFGDSTISMSFPQITIFDEIGEGELSWLNDFSDIDIYIVPPGAANPALGTDTRIKVWEGFLTSMDWVANEDSSALHIQGQGALFQGDKYVQGPTFPPRPVTYERLIRLALDPAKRPHLRTKPVQIVWPAGWTKVQPAGAVTMFTPYGTAPGEKISGYTTRSTGSWDRTLTSYIQNMLQVMYTDTGDQWTMYKNTGRQPVLTVRQRSATPQYSVWASQPGVQMNISRDMTQYANIVFGQGIDSNGAEFHRQIISRDGATTTYEPMASDPRVYPEVSLTNPRFDNHIMRVETFVKYDNGFNERQALVSAKKTLQNDMDPGFSGEMTLTIDPVGGSRYLIKAGEKITVKYLVGSGSTGVTFHIAEVNVNVVDGSVSLKIDTKFRDLLTLEESLVRARDPLTPVKMLQINKRSQLIQDVLAPWDYSKGSGYVPKASIPYYRNVPSTERFPYPAQAVKYNPRLYPTFYVKVNANAGLANNRWTVRVPIRMAQRVDIRHTQFCAYDIAGNRVRCPFHISFYYNPVGVDQMPRGDNGQHSPFIPNAFESTNQYGEPIPAGTPGAVRIPDQSLIIGWGNHDQPAGYSPGSHSSGDPATGMLVDDVSWSADLTRNQSFDLNPAMAGKETEESITIYANFYAEWHTPVYFMGRLFRKEPGT